MNEEQRLKEKDEAEARQKAREQERLTRKEPEVKAYELTLKNVDLPGLPAPLANTNALAKADQPAATIGAVSTNAPTAATTQPAFPHETLGDEAEPDKAPAVDFVLEESEHILVDYLGLLSKNKTLTASRAATP